MKSFKSINKIKNWNYILFLVLFMLTVIYSYLKNIRVYLFDSQYYWTIADSVWDNGFNIMNFPETFRGYFFPFLVSLFKKIFNGIWGWRILSSFAVAVAFAFSLPYLVKQKSVDTLREFIGVFIAYCMFMYIWGDFTQYPLSDLFAAVFMFSGGCLLMQMTQKSFSRMDYCRGGAAGILLYASYNTRVVFLYGVIIALLLFLIYNIKKDKRKMLIFITIFLGILVVALPQCFINQQYTGKFSPKVFSEQLYNYDHDLQSTQVLWGLTMPKYDTYSGNSELYPLPSVTYFDPVGEEIVEREGLVLDNFNIVDIFRLFCKYPMDMIGIYVRHMISALTPSSNEIYITNIYNNKGIIASLSIMIWLIAGIAILNSKNIFNRNILWLLPAFVPSLLQLFGATELRFFLPVYMVGYIYVFAVINYHELWNVLRCRWISMLIISAVIYVLWMAIFGNILSFNTQRTLLINDSLVYTSYVDQIE